MQQGENGVVNSGQRIDRFKRELLKEYFDQCTKVQQDFFIKLYGDPEFVSSDKLMAAIQICERTLDQNEKVNSVTPT